MNPTLLRPSRVLLPSTPVPPGIDGLRCEAIGYFLRRSPVFADLPERDRRELAEATLLRTLAKGAYLFHKNEAATGLYLVRRGIINLHRVAADGREITIHCYREGEIIAANAASEKCGCPADARALVPTEIIVIPRRSFLSVLGRCPELALRLVAAVDHQLHQLADTMEDFVSRNASSRFAQWLLRQCGEKPCAEPFEIELATTKRALAGELGVRQETLSRALRRLSDCGHLQVDGRRITIRNPRALQAMWAADRGCFAHS